MAKTLRGYYSALFEKDSTKFLVIFSFALFLRALPEFSSGVYPVGFDTLQGYIPTVLALPDNSFMRANGWAYSPLAVYLLWFFRFLTGIEPYVLLKIAGPVFYGLFGVSFCYMLSHGLGWSNKKSFFVTLLLLLQPAVLRTGWDQLREELGLMFLFVLIAVTKCDILSKPRFKVFFLVSLSVLIVFSHQLIALLLFVIVSWQLLTYGSKKDSAFLRTAFAMLPSALIFMWQLYSQFLNPAYDNHFVPLQLPTGSGTFVFTNYFLSDPRFLGGNYWTVLSYVGCLLLYTIIPLIPFAIKGYFKDKVIKPLLIWLLPASLSILVYPWYALSQYWWWILLLPIPLTVYIGEYLDKKHVFENTKTSKSKKPYWTAFLMLGMLAVGYAGSSTLGYSSFVFGYPYAYTYLPTGMVQSSIPFTDIPDVLTALEWTNANAPLNSTIIVQEKTMGLAYIELRSDFLIRVSPSLITLNKASTLNVGTSISSYAVWYSENVDNETFL